MGIIKCYTVVNGEPFAVPKDVPTSEWFRDQCPWLLSLSLEWALIPGPEIHRNMNPTNGSRDACFLKDLLFLVQFVKWIKKWHILSRNTKERGYRQKNENEEVVKDKDSRNEEIYPEDQKICYSKIKNTALPSRTYNIFILAFTIWKPKYK